MKYILRRIYILTLMMILSISVFTLCVNVNAEVYGGEIFKSEEDNTEKFWKEVTEKSKTLDMFEIETMRGENVKHYRLSDGTYRAVSYDRPIHVKDEKGNWQEIDNTLIFDGKNYETKDKRVSFSKDISKDAFFMKYEEGDSAINVKIINDGDYSKNEAIVNNYNNIGNLLNERSSEQIYNIENYSTINYSNIFDNTSLECLLDYKTVVNKIRFDSIENSHNISLLINVANLRVELEEGTLMFYNLKNGNLEYKMLQPYVKYNDNIDNTVSQYKLVKTDKDGSEYMLTIEIDLSKYVFKEENGEQMRLLPNGPEIVIVGPIDGGGGGGGSSTPAVYDTYVSSSNTTTNYGSSPEVKVSVGNAQIGYFKIYEPAIPNGSTITDAFFRIPYYFTTSNSNYINVGAYQIMENWSESSVSWSSNINVSNVRLSNAYTYASATESNPGYVILGIGEAAKSWYSRSANNYGIAVKYENGNASTVLMKSWESHAERTTMTIDYSMDELIIKEGTYFIKNGHLDKYIQIDDGDSDNSYGTEDAILEVWTGTGVSFQKWTFEYLHNGYYKIKSYRSGKVIAVKEGNENNSNNALVQQTYDGSDRQQWKITITSSGKYKIKAKSSENYSTDRVMCIGEGIGGNGRNVEQREYSNNNIYKDEWIISTKQGRDATVYNYYDNGYSVRYNETNNQSQQNIDSYMDTIASRYLDLLDFVILHPEVSYYNSPIDVCKGTVNSGNINTTCSHSGTIHTERDSIISSFKSTYPKIEDSTNIYWTGHRVTSTATNGSVNFNRSCSTGHAIIMLEISSESIRKRDSEGVIMHELNHQFGARDHYHELAVSSDPTSCKFKDICSDCGTNKRPKTCVMNKSRTDISLNTVICTECLDEMKKYIEDNYD